LLSIFNDSIIISISPVLRLLFIVLASLAITVPVIVTTDSNFILAKLSISAFCALLASITH